MTGWQWPTVDVQVAFTATLGPTQVAPNTPGATLNWTDIGEYVFPQMTVGYGRQYELDQIEVGTMTLLVLDQVQNFNPANTASPYWPYLVPNVPITVTATWNSVEYTLFTGFVERWPQAWTAGGNLGQCTITCVDPLVVLNAFTLQDWTFNEIWQDSPTAFYSMNDSAGATAAADDSGNGYPSLQVAQSGTGGAVTFGTSGPPDGATGAGITGSGANGAYLSASMTFEDGVYCVEAVLEPSTTAPAIVDLTDPASGPPNGPRRIELGLTSAGYGTCTVYVSGSPESITGTVSLLDGKPHHLALLLTGGLWVFLIDGVQQATTITDASSAPLNFQLNVGGEPAAGHGWTGTISHLAIYGDVPPSVARMQVHAQPCVYEQQAAAFTAGSLLTVSAGIEGTSTRFERLMGWTGSGLATAVVGATGNDIAMSAPLGLSGTSALQAAQDAATVEGGYVYADPAGTVCFVNRFARWLTTTSSATLGEADILYQAAVRAGHTASAWSSSTNYAVQAIVTYQGLTYVAIASGTNQPPASSPSYWSLVEWPYGADIQFDTDPTLIYNVAQVSQTNGITYTATNQPSIDAYFANPIPSMTGLGYAYAQDVINRANWIVSVYGGMYANASKAPAWNASSAYASGAAVSYLGGLYVAQLAVASAGVWSPTAAYSVADVTFNRFTATAAAYNSGTTYDVGMVVSYSGNYYESLQASNTGNTPSTSPTWWSLYTNPGGRYSGLNWASCSAWSNTTAYTAGQEVSYGGLRWLCQVANTGKTPGVAPVHYWRDISPDVTPATGVSGAYWAVSENTPGTYGSAWFGPAAAPPQRIETLSLNAAANPELWPFVLGATIGQRITVRRRPTPLITYSQDYFIERIEHVAELPSETPWELTLQVSPAELFEVFILGDPVYGVLDAGNRLGY